jgi:Cu2+-exporting ATPase
MSATCYHCGLDLQVESTFSAVIGDSEKSFCCHGCQTVCETIHDAGLASFYQKAPESQILTPPAEDFEYSDTSFYDIEEIQADYVNQQGEVNHIDLLVDNIHCAACVWLIEKSLNGQEGVEEAHVNFTTKRLKVAWRPQDLKLSKIFKLLQQIGYQATPFDSDEAEQQEIASHKQLVYRMAFAGFAMMNMLWVSIALYTGADQGEFKMWFYWISFIIATPTFLYAGYPFIKQGLGGLARRQLTMDLPIAIGATVTYSYSTYVLLTPSSTGHIYFDTVVNFLFVILVGRYLEAAARRKALSETHRLMTLQPKLATLIEEGESHVISIKKVREGDIVLVKPGASIPVDGNVISGESAVDESMLTGESIPIVKTVGERVIAGSINTEGALKVQVEQVLNQTALAKMLSLMTQAQQDKAPIQALADKVVPWFVLVTLSLAIVTFLIWYQVDVEKALLAATSVLIITCPCALGLATPMSMAVATGVAAKTGVILKNGMALQQLARVNHIIFDKTGTLTQGKLSLCYSEPSRSLTQEKLLQIAASIESYSEHPIATAIVNEAKKQNITLQAITNFKTFPGKGVSANIQRQHYHIGTQNYIEELGVELAPQWLEISRKCEQEAISTILVVEDNKVSGMMGFRDKLRTDASLTVDTLRNERLFVEVLSGDKEPVVKAVIKGLGDVNYQAELLPEHKVRVIKARQQQEKVIAMIGDGINDAAALTQADVGIAMSSGVGMAVEGADIVLSQNKLTSLLDVKQLADKTIAVIKQNLMLSLSYNVIMVPLAMMAIINPLVAAVTMPISSLLVIANASRIQTSVKGSH